MNNDRIPTRPLNAMELAFQRAAQAKHDRAVRNTTPVAAPQAPRDTPKWRDGVR